MTDVLIRNVDEADLARIDEMASRLGLSRNEYLRRRLVEDAGRVVGHVTVADLQWFSHTYCDLADPEIMRQAWR